MSNEIEQAEVIEETTDKVEMTAEQQIEFDKVEEKKKEMLYFMNLMNDPESADKMFKNPVEFARFKELFGDFKVKTCNRKSCGRLHLKVKGANFCGKECENIYKKRV